MVRWAESNRLHVAHNREKIAVPLGFLCVICKYANVWKLLTTYHFENTLGMMVCKVQSLSPNSPLQVPEWFRLFFLTFSDFCYPVGWFVTCSVVERYIISLFCTLIVFRLFRFIAIVADGVRMPFCGIGVCFPMSMNAVVLWACSNRMLTT